MSADNAGTRHPQRAEIGEDHYAPGRILCRNDPNKGDEPGELAEALAQPADSGAGRRVLRTGALRHAQGLGGAARHGGLRSPDQTLQRAKAADELLTRLATAEVEKGPGTGAMLAGLLLFSDTGNAQASSIDATSTPGLPIVRFGIAVLAPGASSWTISIQAYLRVQGALRKKRPPPASSRTAEA